jgi:hypothetical protein
MLSDFGTKVLLNEPTAAFVPIPELMVRVFVFVVIGPNNLLNPQERLKSNAGPTPALTSPLIAKIPEWCEVKQAIQRAFGDVSDALIGYQKFYEVRVRQEQAVADLEESVRLSIMRYHGGTATYLEVLDGQRSLFAAELP